MTSTTTEADGAAARRPCPGRAPGAAAAIPRAARIAVTGAAATAVLSITAGLGFAGRAAGTHTSTTGARRRAGSRPHPNRGHMAEARPASCRRLSPPPSCPPVRRPR